MFCPNSRSVAFAFMANVGPMIALHAAWIIGLFSSVFGGRPGMIHGATGAKAAVIATFVPCNEDASCSFEDHKIEFLFLAVILCGVLNALFGFFRLSKLMQLIPTPVMIGFCNGLAIVIGLAQIHTFQHNREFVHGWEAFWMVVICFVAMLVMELWPRIPVIGKWLPSTLISILLAVLIEFVIVRMAFGHQTRTIRHVAPNLADGKYPLPFFLNSNYDMTIIQSIKWEDVKSVAIMGVRLFAVGTLEELMTVELMNDLHKNKGSGDQQMFGTALGNIVAGLFGTMGGNSMIGLSVMSYRSGAKGREAGLVTAAGVLIVIAAASQVLNYIPVAALSGVMFVVVIHTFKWFSIPMVFSTILPARIRKCHPQLRRKIKRWDACIIVVVSILTPITDLLLAVCVGVFMAALVFAWESKRKFSVETHYDSATETKYYEIDGPLFYGSRSKFLNIFNVQGDPNNVVAILKGNSALFDYSAMEALNKLKKKYHKCGKILRINGLKHDCIKMVVKANRLVEHVDVTLSEMYVPTVPALYSTDASKAGTENQYGSDENTLPHNSLENVNVEVTTHIEASTTAAHLPPPQPKTVE